MIIGRIAVLMLALATTAVAHAQTYPAKNVRIIVGLAPGGTTDVFTRILAQQLTDTWGQTVIVQRDAARVLTNNQTRDRLTKLGVDLILNTPEEFRTYLQSEIARYTRIVKSAGVKAE